MQGLFEICAIKTAIRKAIPLKSSDPGECAAKSIRFLLASAVRSRVQRSSSAEFRCQRSSAIAIDDYDVSTRRLGTLLPPPRGDDFALSAVPSEAYTTAASIALMLLAANISLPALVMGGQLGLTRGLAGTTSAAFEGGLLLALLGGTCAYVGARSRLTTYLLIVRAFGTRGGELVNLLLTCSVIGWFGVVLVLFAQTMARLAGGMLPLWMIGGTLLMVATTVVGFRALTWLSNILLPAKLGLLLWAVWAAVRAHGSDGVAAPHLPQSMDDVGAVSFVVGGWVVGAVIAPDFSRFARTEKGGALGCAIALGLGYPATLIAASIPAVLTGNANLLATMAALNMGIAALIIVLLASWTGGAINLYCGSLMLATVFRRLRRSLLIWGSAVTGTVLGLAGITDWLVPYLTMLSLIVPPVAGVYLASYFLAERRRVSQSPRRWDVLALSSCAAGVVTAGVAQASGHGLTGIGAIDAVIASASVYVLLDLLRQRRSPRLPTRI